ncbi:MAG: dihydropyrimidinase [Oligoflexia bacterium]|nr:dihydropyrimidinase [Oligoflexia bacterium]
MSSSSHLIIKNGTVITSSHQKKTDILIVDDKIAKIGNFTSDDDDAGIIDASGLLIFPGGVDAHTHMELPVMGIHSSDTFATGTKAALYGGTTTIIDFANQSRMESLNQTLDKWFLKAEGHVYTDYALHLSVTVVNHQTIAELEGIIKHRGVSSFKTFMAYKTMMITDDEIATLMRETSKYGGLVTVHAEDGELIESIIENNISQKNIAPQFHPINRPIVAESNAISRLVNISERENLPIYVVHLSSAEGLNCALNKSNAKIILETCPQYLLLDDSKYLHTDPLEVNKFVMSPPIRPLQNHQHLWKGIADGHIKVVATDHCPFTLEQKKLGLNDFTKVPNGIPGVEHRLEILFSEGYLKGQITLNQLVQVWSTNPARIFGLHPRKGDIVVGADADLVLFDPNIKHTISSKTHHMNVDYSAYEGLDVVGKCQGVMLRGKVAIDCDGVLKINEGYGHYIHRGACVV